MKILITTSSDRNTLAAHYQRHLEEHNEVRLIPAYTFDIEERVVSNGKSGLFLSKFFPAYITNRISTYLFEIVEKTKPDVVFIVKGTFLSPRVIQKIRQQGIMTVNYNPDHPIRFDSAASGNANIRKALKHYDLIYTYSPEIQKEILKESPKAHVKVLPFGYEHSAFNTNNLRTVERINKVCFIGTGDADRRDTIRRILKAGFSVDVYGRGYTPIRRVNSNKLVVSEAKFGDAYNLLLQSYDVQLNLFRRQNSNAHNMRSFEIPAVGGLQVAPYSEQCSVFFREDKEIFMYKDDDTLMSQIEFLLSQSNEQQLQYREAARQRCKEGQYSYAERTRQLVNDLQNF